MNKIYVTGSLNMDITINANRLPEVGETIVGWGFCLTPGGKGANQAVAAAKLGGEVLMYGCVGDDIYGDSLKENLRACGVNEENVISISGSSTGIAVIIVCDADNRIILNQGANGEFVSEICDSLQFEEEDILILQLETPFFESIPTIKKAHKQGAKVIFNPAPAIDFDHDILKYIDILVVNETEAESITSIYPKDEGIQKCMDKLEQYGASSIIITLGDKGCAMKLEGEQTSIHTAFKVDAVDTTAAGDTFIGAFAAGIAQGKDFSYSVKFAQAASALAVSKAGAQNSIPCLEDVRRLLEDN